MSGHLRGNWRETKKNYMISYWSCEHLQSVRGLCNTLTLTEQMRSAGWCSSEETLNSGATPELPVDESLVK